MAAPDPSAMFEPEVVEELRRQFNAADKDGSGELDASEACMLFARSCDADADESQVKKLADNLRNQMDSDRSGTISFNEYCFRFGRRYQQEIRKRRAAGTPTTSATTATSAGATTESEAAAQLRREREALEREREALRREREEMSRARGSQSSGSATSAPPNPAAPSNPAAPMVNGTRVVLQGLRGAAELNGRTGKVLSFDEASGRYVVQLEGEGGQKSLRKENLTPCAATGSPGGTPSATGAFADFSQKAKDGLKKAAAHVQIWMAGYETWQLLLGAAVVVVFIAAYFQVSSRYSGGGSVRDRMAGSRPAGAGGPMPRRDTSRDDFDEVPPFRDEERYEHRDDYHSRDHGRHRHEDRYNDDYQDGYSNGGGGGDYGVGGSGSSNQLWTVAVLGILGILCFKGIIPVHKMDWFQMYMLWNMLSPLLLGGRGGGRRRRGFF